MSDSFNLDPRLQSDDPERLREGMLEYHNKLIESVYDEELSPEVLNALLSRFPYLQAIDERAGEDKFHELEVVPVSTGWVIHSYGAAMAASPGKHCFTTDVVAGTVSQSNQDDDDDDDGGSGGSGMPPGVGTLIKQMFDTAAFMIELALEKGWETFRVVDGYAGMPGYAWLAAELRGLKIGGYQPTVDDLRRLSNLKLGGSDVQKRLMEIKEGKEYPAKTYDLSQYVNPEAMPDSSGADPSSQATVDTGAYEMVDNKKKDEKKDEKKDVKEDGPQRPD